PRGIEKQHPQTFVLLYQFAVFFPEAKVARNIGAPPVNAPGEPFRGIEEFGLVVAMGIYGHHQRNEHKKAVEKGISVPKDKVDDALHAIERLRRVGFPTQGGTPKIRATLSRCSYSVPSF